MQFEFLTPTRILFGPGVLKEAAPLARGLGARAFVVNGTRAEAAGRLLRALEAQGVQYSLFAVSGEPTTELVEEGLRLARQANSDLVIGIGGGSALDTAKALSALLANGGELLDYLEVIGRGRTLTRSALPCIAIPTTAGTGAEVTRNAVLAVPSQRVKVSLRSPLMVPRLALIDPELTYSLPPAVTASTGLDALTQLIEPYVSIRANPVTDALCREGMKRSSRSLTRAYSDGQDYAAREDLVVASLFGGLALANAGLGTIHGFASVIGGMFSAPHGAVCARLLPFTVAANLAALRARDPEAAALYKYDQIAQILTGDSQAKAEDGVHWLEALGSRLNVPALGSYGMTTSDMPLVAEKTLVASSTKANPITLTSDELRSILEQSL
jgi:alcohol dehydrogenase class IV